MIDLLLYSDDIHHALNLNERYVNDGRKWNDFGENFAFIDN